MDLLGKFKKVLAPLYLVDTSAFLDARKKYHWMAYCPAFLEWCVQRNLDGEVASVRQVLDEINVGKDELVDWANKRGAKFFLENDDDTKKEWKRIKEYLIELGYPEIEIEDFMAAADGWIIAHALAHGITVVSHEEQAKDNSMEIKIPDVCKAFGVECINIFEMLRRERPLFVLGKRKGNLLYPLSGSLKGRKVAFEFSYFLGDEPPRHIHGHLCT